MSPLYRRRPIEVEAMRYEPGPDGNWPELREWLPGEWWGAAPEPGVGLMLDTDDRSVHVAPGDWIVKGVTGEFYPVKPAIFERLYEAADDVGELVDRLRA